MKSFLPEGVLDCVEITAAFLKDFAADVNSVIQDTAVHAESSCKNAETVINIQLYSGHQKPEDEEGILITAVVGVGKIRSRYGQQGSVGEEPDYSG